MEILKTNTKEVAKNLQLARCSIVIQLGNLAPFSLGTRRVKKKKNKEFPHQKFYGKSKKKQKNLVQKKMNGYKKFTPSVPYNRGHGFFRILFFNTKNCKNFYFFYQKWKYKN